MMDSYQGYFLDSRLLLLKIRLREADLHLAQITCLLNPAAL
jgi:hypothetical protein